MEDKFQKKYRKILVRVFLVGLMLLAGMTYLEKQQEAIPDRISVFAGETYSFDDNGTQAFSGKELGNYEVNYKLFGWFPIKNVSVNVVERQMVIPCGIPVGIYVETDGVLVIGSEEVTKTDGSKENPVRDVLRKGDYITSIDGKQVNRKAVLTKAVEESGGKPMILGVRRKNEEFEVSVKPVEYMPGKYQLGIWVRDNTQGIGTITYMTKEGCFGALGHGISDIDTGSLLETNRGLLYETDIMTVVKGQKGKPGELVGYIDYQAQHVQGRIDSNTTKGIYGVANKALQEKATAQPVQVCLKQDIQTGAATILACIDEQIKEYQVEIEGVHLSEKEENKGIELKVTDQELLEKTGGIVQGLSGAPILQNGKIVGAVTHVLVNDPTRGYGIFIENMLEH